LVKFLTQYKVILINEYFLFTKFLGYYRKEGVSGRNRALWEGRVLGTLFFFIIQNPPNSGNSKNIYWKTILKGIGGLR
jgi:hypothetical protein